MSYFPEVIDERMRRTFIQCPQKARYEFIDHLAAFHEPAEEVMERAIKCGIDLARRRYFIDAALAVTSTREGRACVQQKLADSRPPAEYVQAALKCYDEYFVKFPLGADGHHPALFAGRRLVAERCLFPLPIRHPVTCNPLQYCVHIDMLSVDETDGSFSVIDDRFGKGNFPLSLDFDISAKLWVAREIYQIDFPLAEVRVFSPSGISARSTMRQKWMLTRWYRQLCADIQRMVQSYYPKVEWGYNFDSTCVGCPYVSLCLSETQVDTGPFKNEAWIPQTRERKAL